jgi:hypothetical protein
LRYDVPGTRIPRTENGTAAESDSMTRYHPERWPDAITLGDLRDAGLALFCWCNRCGHNAVIATEALIAVLAPGTPVPAIGQRMRCSACGGSDISTRPAWPSAGPVTRHT